MEFKVFTLCFSSAYVYSYVAVGEFVGFIIGWNLLLEYVIGAIQKSLIWKDIKHLAWKQGRINYFQARRVLLVPTLATWTVW